MGKAPEQIIENTKYLIFLRLKGTMTTMRPISPKAGQSIVIKLSATLLLFLFIGPVSAFAKNLSDLYDRQTLEYWQERYLPSTNRIFGVLLTVFTASESEKLAQVDLRFPLVGELKGDPLEFYFSINPATVTMPVLSIKFLDDLCIAWAWLWTNDKSLQTITNYMATIKYNKAERFPGGRYPTPLEALSIPHNALDDPTVDKLSLRLFNSARTFILAHQLGHIYYNLPNYASTIKRANAELNEENADAFALDIMRRTSTIPMGMVLFFEAGAYWKPIRADFESDSAWAKYLEKEAIHPLTAKRLTTLASQLERMAGDFASSDETNKTAVKDAIDFITASISSSAEMLQDIEMQRLIATNALAADLASITTRRPKGQLAVLSPVAVNSEHDKPNIGTIVFNVPTDMHLGQSLVIHILLLPSALAGEVQRKIAEQGDVISDHIRISNRMELKLSGTGFQITSITPELQAISTKDRTEWKWDIEPIKSGIQRFHLTVNIMASVEGSDLPRTIRTIDKEVVINISWIQRVYSFIGAHWQWLWATVIVPIFAWVWKYTREKQKHRTR